MFVVANQMSGQLSLSQLLLIKTLEQLFILPVGNSVSVHCPIFYMKKFVKVYNPPTNAARMHL